MKRTIKRTMKNLKKIYIATTNKAKQEQIELIFEQSVKEARAASLPFVQFFGAYNFTRAKSEAGIVFLNRQAGFNGGVSAGWTIFNGGKNNRLVKESNILALNQKH